ncbi:hypothetical protein BDV95DRAFT_605937 [Massariosphaeria phaeospora]|uniref:Uncharacterized protein n=1 Tax=Massariosphaeria phaeospora TaxID=100035 RepID=A0A7C8IEQ8_9PLEO|nr:hypothetical protein BDV95DRAFT_605937 [Massariosphaeria phaeospora]
MAGSSSPKALANGLCYPIPKSAQRTLTRIRKALPNRMAADNFNEHFRDLAPEYNHLARRMNRVIDQYDHEGFAPVHFHVINAVDDPGADDDLTDLSDDEMEGLRNEVGDKPQQQMPQTSKKREDGGDPSVIAAVSPSASPSGVFIENSMSNPPDEFTSIPLDSTISGPAIGVPPVRGYPLQDPAYSHASLYSRKATPKPASSLNPPGQNQDMDGLDDPLDRGTWEDGLRVMEEYNWETPSSPPFYLQLEWNWVPGRGWVEDGQ